MTETKVVPKKVVLVGVPFDLGASTRGCAGGPAAIRRTELVRGLEGMGLAVEDTGDLPVASGGREDGTRMKHYTAVRKVCEALAERTHQAAKAGAVPVVLGGDHSVAMGSISGVARAARERKKPIGVVWVDAHGDTNTPQTSPSGNLHGMPLAHLLGMGDRRLSHLAGFSPALESARVCLAGIRDLDEREKATLRKTKVHVFTMADIDRHGMARIAEEAVAVAGERTAGIHVSFDIDAADPSIAQGVGTKKRGGLTYREAHLLMEVIAESGKLISLDMMEVNPLEDVHNTTAELASELIQSALGKRIY